tara:strand:- start:354 stop:719 length:366 start_codon:yes stop_codon:yes gene_type:complete
MINKIIEKIFHGIIYIMIIILCGKELQSIILSGTLTVGNILMMFVFLELMQMVSIFFSSGKIPVRYPLYISLIALARHISLENIIGIEALYLSGSIILIAGALVGLAYRDKLLNHKEPELK